MVSDHAHPPRGLTVREVTLRDFRSYTQLELRLEPGLVLITGANGSGKTNLLEALHLGTQGFSPRVRSDAQLVRFGAEAGRVALRGTNDASPFETAVIVSRVDARRAQLNGDTTSSSEQLRSTFRTLVFTPDRLAVVKGGPAIRRAYLDRAMSRILPAKAHLPLDYASALGQRNAALRRVDAGLSSRAALGPWTMQVAETGHALVAARAASAEILAPAFATAAAHIGLTGATLVYEGDAPSTAELDARIDRDVERGFTGIGPHLHDLRLEADDRDLRTYGSQGEQRTAVLALVLAEAAAIAERTGTEPLVLLDDVLSELDASRRRALAELAADRGQTVITATSPEVLPLVPAQALVVTDGSVRST